MINKIKQQWDEIIRFLQTEYSITNVSYKTWIMPLKPCYFDDNTLYISVPDDKGKLMIDYLKNKYQFFLQVAIEEVTGIKCDICFEEESVITRKNPTDTVSSINNKTSAMRDTSLTANLNSKYTFDTFVVGANNKFAHAASLAVAESPAECYNPLFIYGGVGLGKTHLMHSIANFITRNDPAMKVLYVTSESYTTELVDLIRNNNNTGLTRFKEKYRNVDVLLIDDIQFIIGKERTQEEFFHTFNYLYENNKQIVISSDRSPNNFDILDDRLKSRFAMGLSVDISVPDYETRLAILRKKEELENYNIDNEVLSYIATNVVSNIRELEGALTKVTAYSKLYGEELNLSLAEEALKDVINPNAKKEITLELIINTVADHYDISPEEMLSKKRNKELVVPRQIAMYLCRKMTNASLKSIATALNRGDHTTVINGCTRVEEELQDSPALKDTLDVLEKKISSS